MSEACSRTRTSRHRPGDQSRPKPRCAAGQPRQIRKAGMSVSKKAPPSRRSSRGSSCPPNSLPAPPCPHLPSSTRPRCSPPVAALGAGKPTTPSADLARCSRAPRVPLGPRPPAGLRAGPAPRGAEAGVRGEGNSAHPALRAGAGPLWPRSGLTASTPPGPGADPGCGPGFASPVGPLLGTPRQRGAGGGEDGCSLALPVGSRSYLKAGF